MKSCSKCRIFMLSPPFSNKRKMKTPKIDHFPFLCDYTLEDFSACNLFKKK